MTESISSAFAMPVDNIRIGTCGWTEKGLIDSERFYPEKKMTAEERLRFYATYFSIVEVDSTFYAVPSEQTAKLWVERTPGQFRFNVKALGLFTQHACITKALPVRVRELLAAPELKKPRVYMRSLSRNAETVLWDMFRGGLTPLAEAGKLGAVHFQFPHWFHRNRVNIGYLESLQDRLPWQIAVEFRGGGWMTEEAAPKTLALLRRLGFAYAIVDEPQGFDSSTPMVLATTAPLSILRLHGRNRDTWEAKGLPDATHRFNYLYNEEELEDFEKKTERLAGESEEVHVLFNNNYRDYHVRNAAQFSQMLKKLKERGELPTAHPSESATLH